MKNFWTTTALMPTDLDEEKRVVHFTQVKVSRIPLLRRYWHKLEEAGYITEADLECVLNVIDANTPLTIDKPR